MKQRLEDLLQRTVVTLKKEGILRNELSPKITVERAKDSRHGDFASNLAMVLAKSARTNPRRLAEKIIAVLPDDPVIVKVEIAGPGFINFFIDTSVQHQIIKQIHDQGVHFGRCQIGAGKEIHIEFVSANPTGPLHVGHGRGAIYGSVIADLLEAVGFEVHREYYVNDAGRQMDILTISIWLRYLEECGEVIPFPCTAYRGEYVREIAWKIYKNSENEYRRPAELVLEDIPKDEIEGGDKEEHIDALIMRAKTLLGSSQYNDLLQIGLNTILEGIKRDLADFGVKFQEWFSERQLINDGSVQEAVQRLREAGYLYEQNGAIWFACRQLGDEKDRVVVRENGQTTYFASDIAYHMNKIDRGFDLVIDIWGADHHGYIPRVKAAIQALGADATKLEVLLVQFAVLYRGDEKVQMSTRSGQFVTLRQLCDEVGKDAARFFYVMRKSEQHMDFDLKLATSKTKDNPVFYVQYAYARVCSVLRKLDEKGWVRDLKLGMENLDKLTEENETTLISILSRYEEKLERSALKREPHILVHYLRELAKEFHLYYFTHEFLIEDPALRNARLNLICATKQIIANGLGLLNVNTPESM